MHRAAIDIGSNSLLLTIVDEEGALVHDEARVVGLGRGLGDRGLFQPERMKAAEAALSDYVQVARRHGIEPWSIRAVGTSACRRAMNAETWTARIQRDLGVKIHIVSGADEARLTWLGAGRDLELPEGPLLVVDLGGGSTELVLGEGGAVERHASLEVGSVRLTEEYLGTALVDPAALTRLRRWVEVQVDRFSFVPAPRTVIGVAGSVTSLATRVLGLDRYDADQVHGWGLTRSDLRRTIDLLLPAGPEERRRLFPAAPDRADYLLAAAVVLDEILHRARRQQLVVSDRGLRFGLLAY